MAHVCQESPPPCPATAAEVQEATEAGVGSSPGTAAWPAAGEGSGSSSRAGRKWASGGLSGPCRHDPGKPAKKARGERHLSSSQHREG